MGKKKKKKKQRRPAASGGAGSRLRSFLAHPVVADVLAAGLIALANALKETRTVRETTSKAKDKADDAAEAVNEVGRPGSEAAEFGVLLAAKAKEQARRLGGSYFGVDGGADKGGNGSGGKGHIRAEDSNA